MPEPPWAALRWWSWWHWGRTGIRALPQGQRAHSCPGQHQPSCPQPQVLSPVRQVSKGLNRQVWPGEGPEGGGWGRWLGLQDKGNFILVDNK